MLNSRHTVGPDGRPYGGTTSADGLLVAWEECEVETVILTAVDRLEFEQRRQPSPEHGEALGHLAAALEALS